MKIHQASCVHNYGTTTEYYELEEIRDVFGHQEASKVVLSEVERL